MPANSTPRTVAVLGGGNIGRPIGRHWAAAGHSVTFGSRDPGRLRLALATDGIPATTATYPDAARAADIVLLAVPYPAYEDLLTATRDALVGSIVVDATNPMGLSPDGRIVSTLGTGLSQGRRTAKLLPESRIVRAFSHVMDELLWSRGTQQRHFWGMAVAGDDDDAKTAVAGLVSDAGFTPVDLGGLDDSLPLDPGGVLFPHMFTPADLRATAGLDN